MRPLILAALLATGTAVAGDCPCPPVDGPKPVVKRHVPKPTPPPAPVVEKVRPLIGGGLLYGQEHRLGAALFGGVQFAQKPSGGTWQIQGGLTWQPHDDFNAQCAIGCRTCQTHADAATPLGTAVSLVYVF